MFGPHYTYPHAYKNVFIHRSTPTWQAPLHPVRISIPSSSTSITPSSSSSRFGRLSLSYCTHKTKRSQLLIISTEKISPNISGSHRASMRILVWLLVPSRLLYIDNTLFPSIKTSKTGEVIEVPGRYDMCECQNLFKCQNGTISNLGSQSNSDCYPVS